MKVTNRAVTAQEPLVEGDTITFSISHELKIGRESTWVKYEVMSKVRESESTESAKRRVVDHVNESVMESITKVVDAVLDRSA